MSGWCVDRIFIQWLDCRRDWPSQGFSVVCFAHDCWRFYKVIILLHITNAQKMMNSIYVLHFIAIPSGLCQFVSNNKVLFIFVGWSLDFNRNMLGMIEKKQHCFSNKSYPISSWLNIDSLPGMYHVKIQPRFVFHNYSNPFPTILLYLPFRDGKIKRTLLRKRNVKSKLMGVLLSCRTGTIKQLNAETSFANLNKIRN